MKNAVISLSFDDGRGDNFRVIETILAPRGIPATLNITTGYVDGTCPVKLRPSGKSPLTVENVKKLANSPHVELALHGDCHQNSINDIATGREKMIKWLEKEDSFVFGFASPGSGMRHESFVNSHEKLFQKQISYMRTGLRIQKHELIRNLCRKAGRILHIPLLYQIAYADTLMTECPDRVIYSVPIMKDTTVAQVKAIIDLAVRRNCALTLMFHSIVKNTKNEDNWSWAERKFISVCDYLKKIQWDGKVSLMTTQQLADELRNIT